MPKARSRITIVGLGSMGQSLGLALRAALPDTEIVGHDRDPDAARAATRAGAVARTNWNLPSSCDGASLVILALPTQACLATLEALQSELAPGTVITDTAPLKQPLARWATEHLPATVHFVGGDPLARPHQPSAQAFADSIYCITPLANSDPGAVETVSHLAELLGARPAYLDPVEHDGIMWQLRGASSVVAAVGLGRLSEIAGHRDAGWLAAAIPPEVGQLAQLGEDLLASISSADDWATARAPLVEFRDALSDLLRQLDEGAATGTELATSLRQRREAGLRPDRDQGGPTEAQVRASALTWRRMLGLR